MTEDLQKLVDSVITASAKSINQSEDSVKTGGRHRDLIRARHIGWMIIADLTAEIRRPDGVKQLTLEAIGKAYGGFDHSSVIHGINVARSKVWGDGVNPPLALWAKAYEDMLAELSPTLAENSSEDPRLFFPYTPLGHANARRFLRDIRKTNLRYEGMEDIISFANQCINQYRL